MKRSKLFTGLAFCALVVFSFPGCGLVFGGTSETISIASSPSEARVEVTQSGGATGYQRTTPTDIELERKHDYIVTFTKEGYESRTAEIDHGVRAGIVVLDILFGVVPVIVDAATGAWHGLSPDHIDVTLERTEMSLSQPSEIRVQMELQEDGSGYTVTSEEPVRVQIRKKEE